MVIILNPNGTINEELMLANGFNMETIKALSEAMGGGLGGGEGNEAITEPVLPPPSLPPPPPPSSTHQQHLGRLLCIYCFRLYIFIHKLRSLKQLS